MSIFQVYEGRGVRSSTPRDWPTMPVEKLSAAEGYQAGPKLANAVNVALHLGQPLLLTGEPGTGKTMLAKSLAHELGLPLLVHETKSTSTAADLFYQYNALAQFHASRLRPTGEPVVENPRAVALQYLTYNALGEAILRACPIESVAELLPPGFDHVGPPTRTVVLLDEIDKAPRDLPNDILSTLDKMEFRIPELGNILVAADRSMRPIVVMTSNSEKALPDPFLRRCIYFNIPFPDAKELYRIIRARISPEIASDPLVNDAIKVHELIRKEPTLRKRPATAELLGWLLTLGQLSGPEGNILRSGTLEELERTTPCLAKSDDDIKIVARVFDKWTKDRGRTV